MLTASITLTGLLAMFGVALLQRRRALPLAERIDAILPQTQCTQCGHPGCLPYAQAIAEGRAGINQCPPGGDRVIRRIARLTGTAPLPLDPARGVIQPRAAALIDEATCIGCTLCIQACPVDAIVGAPKLMHTVLARECTGCELCIPPCPVDCISMVPAARGSREWIARGERRRADHARERYRSRQQRIERDKREHAARMAQKAAAGLGEIEASNDPASERKRAVIEAAMARAHERLARRDERRQPQTSTQIGADKRG